MGGHKREPVVRLHQDQGQHNTNNTTLEEAIMSGKEGASRPLGPDGKPIPGPAEVRQIQAARKMAQVEEVIGIMHTNVENVLERDRKLGDLEERADALQDGCAQFEKQAAAMKNKFWMENLKAIIAGSVVGLIVLGLLYWKFFMPETQYHPAPPVAAAPPADVGPVAPANEPSVSDDSPAAIEGGAGGSEGEPA